MSLASYQLLHSAIFNCVNERIVSQLRCKGTAFFRYSKIFYAQIVVLRALLTYINLQETFTSSNLLLLSSILKTSDIITGNRRNDFRHAISHTDRLLRPPTMTNRTNVNRPYPIPIDCYSLHRQTNETSASSLYACCSSAASSSDTESLR